MSIGITSGLKAIFAAQIAMQTAGHNIANANVEGYSRQSVLLRTDQAISYAGVGYMGTGVKTAGTIHTVDDLLEKRLRDNNRALGRLGKESSLLGQVEGLFNEPSDNGISDLFSKFFASLNDMSLDPTDSTRRSNVVMSAQVLSDGFNTLGTQLSTLREDIESELETKVDKVNQLTLEIYQITSQISNAASTGQQPNDLIDRRNTLTKELNYLVDAQVQQTGTHFAVLIDGRIVASHGTHVNVEVDRNASGEAYLHLETATSALNVRDGEIQGLLNQHNTNIPTLESKINTLSSQFLYEFNRIHSKGVPPSGAFTFLKSDYKSKDLNVDLDPTNEKLTEAGLPFPPSAGSLFVTVTNQTTGVIEQTEITIDPDDQSLAEIADLLADIDHVGAYADSNGYLNISAEAGYTFDFTPTLNPAPDADKTFGSKSALIVSDAEFPVTMSAGDTLTIAEDGVNLPAITFVGGTYTAAEIASEINSQSGVSVASVVNGKLVIKATSEGSGSTIQALNTVGDPADTLELSTSERTGADLEVAVELGGTYTGTENVNWRFVASGTGTIGVTPNLTVTVYDEDGALVDILDVGQGYSPGDDLEVSDGITVSFSSGNIDETAGDFFEALLIGDSDTSGILASLGLNTFFTGEDASDIAVRDNLIENPSLIAGSLSHAEGDNANVLRMAELEDRALDGLGSVTVIDHFSASVGKLGLDKKWADDMLDIQEILMANLENERASISGVSIDEELLNLEKFQQMLDAAARYLQVVNETLDTLIKLV
ncbi:MAG: flagellar hook-associated protein FlgK [Planctomycetes bacterium]|nr:flagellar hook-associated protein FlgK [Planctomycetota bacterium]